MNSFRIALATALLLLAMTPLSAAHGDRVTLYEQEFAPGFVGSQQQYLVLVVPEGYDDVRLEVDCNLHVGGITITGWLGQEAAVLCDGLFERTVLSEPLTPGYYYGAASFTGLNGVTVRVTGFAA